MTDKKKSRKEKRNKELQKETLREAWWDTLRGETRHSILSITFLVFGIFFVLASLGKAGVLGNTLYKSFIFLFGAGYFSYNFRPSEHRKERSNWRRDVSTKRAGHCKYCHQRPSRWKNRLLYCLAIS